MDFNIQADNRQISVQEGETLLTALRRNGFKVPTLCHMNRFSPTGACRLCVVEVEGKRDLITSCSFPVEKGMRVLTNSPRVVRARKSLVELLLSNHPDDCLYCQRNGDCELQWLAGEMNVKERKYFGEKNRQFPDHSSSSVFRDPAKCVLCGRCVRMCEEVQLVTAIDFIGRGNVTSVNSAFLQGLNVSSCIHCGQCIMVCPTAALLDISHLEKVEAALNHPGKKVACFVSPSVVASVAEQTGSKVHKDLGAEVAATLEKCGAERVTDLGVACDANVAQEALVLRERMSSKESAGPVLSSCCPAWVSYLETFRPEWLPLLSGVSSPQQLMGAGVKSGSEKTAGKEEVFTVAVMPCVAKKQEASREEYTHKGVAGVDAVLTVREYFRLVRSHGLVPGEPGQAVKPFLQGSAAAWKMAYSGGKAEAVAAELYRLTGPHKQGFRFNTPKNQAARKESRVVMGRQTPGFAWVSGIAEADRYIGMLLNEKRKDIHYVEVMACPGGCAGGGGQPVSRHPDKIKNRKKICMEMERLCEVKVAGENPLAKHFQGS
jgi:iron only hydrogenase large subunit-like protein/ferredoxin